MENQQGVVASCATQTGASAPTLTALMDFLDSKPTWRRRIEASTSYRCLQQTDSLILYIHTYAVVVTTIHKLLFVFLTFLSTIACETILKTM